jgi:hypothetical protein
LFIIVMVMVRFAGVNDSIISAKLILLFVALHRSPGA